MSDSNIPFRDPNTTKRERRPALLSTDATSADLSLVRELNARLPTQEEALVDDPDDFRMAAEERVVPEHARAPKERFASLFATCKPQTYHDPASRGPGVHSIRAIAWSPTGRFIATGSADRTLRIWNPEKPQVKNSTELRGHAGAIERVAWNPVKEADLVSVSSDGTARFWDVVEKKCVATLQLGGEGLTVAWSADGSTVMVGRKDDMLIHIAIPDYALGTFSPQPTQTNQTIFPHAPADAPPNHILLTTGTGAIKFCKFPSLEVTQTINAHTSSASCLALSPTARYLATGGSDALICLFDTTDWVCQRTLSGCMGAIRSVSFTFDGSYVCGGSDDGGAGSNGGIEIAHVETGEVVFTVPTTAPAACVAFHPARYWLAYSGDAGGLKILGPAGGVF